MLLTVLVMNLHHLLYGLSLGRRFNFSHWQRLVAAFFVTDAAYGMAIAEEKRGNIWFLFGAELSMFTAWNLFTGLGIWLGSRVAVPPAAQLDFVVPLTFFLLLVSILKSRLDLLVAIASLGVAVAFNVMGVGNTAVLLVGISGSLFGLGISTFHEQREKR
jgi:predicted branched-subunit amino acid permease